MGELARRYAAIKAARASAPTGVGIGPMAAPAPAPEQDLSWGRFLRLMTPLGALGEPGIGAIADAAGRGLGTVRRATTDLMARKSAGLMGVPEPPPKLTPEGLVEEPGAVEMALAAMIPEQVGEPTGARGMVGAVLPEKWAKQAQDAIPDPLVGIEAALASLGASPEWVGFPRKAARSVAGIVAGLATDPLTALGGVSTARALGAKSATALGRTAAIDRGLAALGAATGLSGGAKAASKAAEAAAEGKGPEASLDALEAILQLGMGGLGVAGYKHSKGLQEAAKAAQRGKIYVHDPAAPAELRAARAAEMVDEARAAAAPKIEVERLEAEAIRLAEEAEAAKQTSDAQQSLQGFDAIMETLGLAPGAESARPAAAERLLGEVTGPRPIKHPLAQPGAEPGPPLDAADVDAHPLSVAPTEDVAPKIHREPGWTWEELGPIEVEAYRGAPSEQALTNNLGTEARFGPGIYSADLPRVAEIFAEHRGRGARVLQERVRIERPFNADRPDTSTTEFARLRNLLIEEGLSPSFVDWAVGPDPRHNAFQTIAERLGKKDRSFWPGANRLNAILQEAGFDGIVGTTRDSPDLPNHTEFVRFKPPQETAKPLDLSERARSIAEQRSAREAYEAARLAEELAPDQPRPKRGETASGAEREMGGRTPEQQLAADVARSLRAVLDDPLEAAMLGVAEEALPLVSLGPDVRLSPAAARAAQEVGASGAQIPKARSEATRQAIRAALEAEVAPEKWAKEDAPLTPEAQAASDAAAAAQAAAKAARTGLAPESGASARKVVTGARTEGKTGEATPAEAKAAEEQSIGVWQRVLDRFGTFKAAEKHLENLPDVGPELAGRARAYIFDKDTLPQRWQAQVMRAMEEAAPGDTKGGAALFESLVPAIEGQVPIESLAPAQQRIVAAARKALDDTRDQFLSAYRAKYGKEPSAAMLENYFPHVAKDKSPFGEMQSARILAREKNMPFEDALAALREDASKITGSRNSRATPYEQARTKQPVEYRRDVGVLMDYFQAMGDRIAELRHLGRDGSEAQALIDRLPRSVRLDKSGFGDRAFAQTFLDRIRNVELGVEPGVKAYQSALHLARTGSAVSGLTMSWTLQPLQMLQTVRLLGPKAVAIGIKDIATRGLERGEMANPLRVAKQLRQNLRQARIDAHEIGAANARLNYEQAELWAQGGDAAPDTLGAAVSEKAGRAPWLRATSFLDNNARAATLRAWETVGQKMIERAKAGDGREARALDFMGIDWKGYQHSPEAWATVSKQAVDAMQYRPHATNLPPWAGSPLGRVAFQFGSYAHQHTRFVGYLLKNAAKDPGRTAAYVAIGLPFAMGTNWFRDALKGWNINEEDVNSENFSRALTEALAGKRRVATFAGPHEALVNVARGVLAMGTGGVFQAALERVGGESVGDMAPALRAVDTFNTTAEGVKGLAGATAEAALQGAAGDPARHRAALAEQAKAGDTLAKATARGVAAILPQQPIPGVMSGPSELVAELQSEKKRTRSGWAGWARDIAEEIGLVAPLDPSSIGREGRKLQAQIEEDTKAAQEARKRGDLGLTPKPRKPLSEKATEAEKSRARAAYRERLIAAQAAGDPDAMLQVLIEAAQDGISPSSLGYRDVMERTMMLPSEGVEAYQ